jgi:hypothetical protein
VFQEQFLQHPGISGVAALDHTARVKQIYRTKKRLIDGAANRTVCFGKSTPEMLKELVPQHSCAAQDQDVHGLNSKLS